MPHKLKMRQSLVDDEFWTPKELIEKLCKKHNFPKPQLDAAANKDNTKAIHYLTDALHQEWLADGKAVPTWCNPPQHKKPGERFSEAEKFIIRGEHQQVKHQFPLMMIVTANIGSTKTWHKYIEDKREHHHIEGRIRFRKHGFKSEFMSRNAYMVIIWRANSF